MRITPDAWVKSKYPWLCYLDMCSLCTLLERLPVACVYALSKRSWSCSAVTPVTAPYFEHRYRYFELALSKHRNRALQPPARSPLGVSPDTASFTAIPQQQKYTIGKKEEQQRGGGRLLITTAVFGQYLRGDLWAVCEPKLGLWWNRLRLFPAVWYRSLTVL